MFLVGLDVIFETSPINLEGTSLTKMALEWIGMLIKIPEQETYVRELLARDAALNEWG